MYFLKIVFLGKSHIGKTKLIKRLVENKYNEHYSETIGMDYFTREGNPGESVQIWDTTGVRRRSGYLESINYMKQFWLGIEKVIYCIDLTDVELNLEEIENDLIEIRAADKTGFEIILAGTKADKVSPEQAEQRLAQVKKAFPNDFKYSYATSALNIHHPGLKALWERINTKKVQQECIQIETINFPDSYSNLWREEQGTNVEKALAILKDYCKYSPKFSILSGLGLFFTGHWNRHHTDTISSILDHYQEYGVPSSVEEVLSNLKNELQDVELRQNGSLDKRIRFIEAMGGETSILHKPGK